MIGSSTACQQLLDEKKKLECKVDSLEEKLKESEAERLELKEKMAKLSRDHQEDVEQLTKKYSNGQCLLP